MAGFEVGELALHGVDEEADGDEAIFGFLADDLGESGADGVGGALGLGFCFGLPLRLGRRLRLGAGIAVGSTFAPVGAGAVDDSLGLVEAEFDEESCGVDAVAWRKGGSGR